MRKIRIMTDSASDISLEDEKKYDIDVLPFRLTIDNKSYTPREDCTKEEFYSILEKASSLPITSQITTFQFEDIYENKMNDGVADLILVLINGEGSATYKNALYAKKLFYEEFIGSEEKINIYVIDGRSYTGAYGQPVLDAALMVKDGLDALSIVKYLEEKIQKRMIYFGMYTLKYAAKSGRIPSAAAFVGEALGLKPVMKIFDHHITTAKKARGEHRIIPTIIDLVVEKIVPGSSYSLVYGSDESLMLNMKKQITEVLGYPPISEFKIGAAVAINAGPKVVGVIFDAKED